MVQGSAPSYTPSFLESQIKHSELLGGEAAVGGAERGPRTEPNFSLKTTVWGKVVSISFTCRAWGPPAFPIL